MGYIAKVPVHCDCCCYCQVAFKFYGFQIMLLFFVFCFSKKQFLVNEKMKITFQGKPEDMCKKWDHFRGRCLEGDMEGLQD